MKYSADWLPDGLSINEDTGLITGTIKPGAAANIPSPFGGEGQGEGAVTTITAGDASSLDKQMFRWTPSSPVALTDAPLVRSRLPSPPMMASIPTAGP